MSLNASTVGEFRPMPEEPWTTLITIHCANPALQKHWDAIASQLRQCVNRCGWDTMRCTVKLKEIDSALRQIRDLTVDMNKPLRTRYK